jgi:hypothetical protein
MGPGELGSVVAYKVAPYQIGPGERVLGMRSRQHGAPQSGSARSRETGDRVLDRDTTLGRQIEHFAGAVEPLRVWFAGTYVLGGNDLREVRTKIG